MTAKLAWSRTNDDLPCFALCFAILSTALRNRPWTKMDFVGDESKPKNGQSVDPYAEGWFGSSVMMV